MYKVVTDIGNYFELVNMQDLSAFVHRNKQL